jgi:O-antigen ligase
VATTLHLAAPAHWLTAGTPIERATRALAVLTGFSIPLSTSFSEITTGLFIAGWVLSGDFPAKWGVIRRNTVALLSLALFGLLLVGTSWSVAGFVAAGNCLLKYREFVYVPMFVVVFQDARLRTLATSAFMAGAALLLGLSYFEWVTTIDLGMLSNPLDMSPVVSKDRIIHSLIMAYLAYLAAVRFAFDAQVPAAGAVPARYLRWLYAGTAALAVYNILFMIAGRTGYLLLGALSIFYLFERLRGRGVVVACLFLGVAAWGGLTFSEAVQGRVEQTISQLENHFGPERKHSVDPRLEFYENALKLVRRHPVRGTGTGSFEEAYARLVAGTDDRPICDPHNEYLHLACQVGFAGPLLFIGLLGWQWFAAGRLPAADRYIGRGIVVTIACGSLFNSLILSVTGGVIYAYFSGVAFAALSQQPESEALETRCADETAEERSPQRLAA